MLTINYFASLREEFGISSEQMELPALTTSVAQLVDHLAELHGERWEALQDRSRVLVAVDQTIVERTCPLQGNEEIAFFPPMTGG